MIPSPDYILLATKTILPVSKKNLVHRGRLTDCLNLGIQSRLTTVCAPAGFGKTTLLSQWIGAATLTAAWLSLDEWDNDLLRFWRYAVQSVNAASPASAAKRYEQLMTLLPSTSINIFIDAFVNDLYITAEPIVFVWDDYQFIQQPGIHESVAYFIDRLPAHAHLVIASRAELPFSTAKWTSRDEHAEIDIAQLQFTIEETEAYYSDAAPLADSSFIRANRGLGNRPAARFHFPPIRY